MKMIQTHDGELINFANIIKIQQVEGEGTQDGNPVSRTFYGLQAIDINGNEHNLALYDSETEAEEVYEVLKMWLALSVETLYTMPGGDEDGKAE